MPLDNKFSSYQEEGIDDIYSADYFGEMGRPITTEVKSITSQVAAVRQHLQPEVSYFDHFQTVLSEVEQADGNYLPILEESISQFGEAYQQEITNFVQDSLGEKDAVDLGTAAYELMDETNEQLRQVDGPELTAVLAANGEEIPLATEFLYYQRKIHELTKDQGFFEKLYEGASYIFIPKTIKDYADLTNSSILEAGDAVKNVFANWQSLSQEERLRTFPMMVGAVMEASDNNELRAVDTLLSLIDPSRASEVSERELEDRVEWGLIAAPFIGWINRVRKTANIVSTAKRLGLEEEAGRINAANLSDRSGAVSQATGVDREVSAVTGHPFNFGEIIPESPDGVHKATHKALDDIEKHRSRVQDKLHGIADDTEYLKERGLTDSEVEKVHSRFQEEINSLKDEYWERYGWYIDDVNYTSSQTGFKVDYKLEGVPQTRSIKYTTNDVGEFKAVELGPIETKILSPSVLLETIAPGAVEQATRIGFVQSATVRHFREAAKLADKGLAPRITAKGSRQRQNIDDVLLAGDEWDKGVGKVFTPDELMEGVETPNGLVRLSLPEMKSYYARRDIMDLMHFRMDKGIRDDLVARGMKEVNFNGEVDKSRIRIEVGRPIEDPSRIPEDIKHLESRVWSQKDGGGVVHMKDVDVKEMYDEGYQLVNFRNRVEVGDEFVTYGFIRKQDISDIRSSVLHKKPGYVPKSYKDGFYFVKQMDNAKVNGVTQKNLSTLRIFDSKLEADKYAQKLTETNQEPGRIFQTFHDREIPEGELAEDLINEVGGLVYGARSRREILFGSGDGTTPRRVSAYQSMDRALNMVGHHMPMNQFRLYMQQRWLNTAKEHLETPGNFDSAINPAAPSRVREGLEFTRRWIRDTASIPTKDERKWQSLLRRTAEWMEGRNVLGVPLDPKTKAISPRLGIYHLSKQDPLVAMRGAAFHSLLGWFNPAQLWVQAQGAAVALSLNPKGLSTSLPKYMALRAGIVLHGNEKALRATAKRLKMDEDEYISLVTQMHKSGLLRSVKTTADYAASEGVGHGVTRSVMRDTADKGLFFFREGEMFSRGYSFIEARAKYLKDTGKRGVDLTDDDLKNIVDDTLKRTFNLNKANRAYWQKGILSIPTQFLQISAKFTEDIGRGLFLDKGKFTRGDASKVLLGQMALYGTAGLSINEMVVNGTARQFGIDVPGEISPEARAAITNGFWGLMAKVMFDVDAELGPRGSIPSGLQSSIVNLMRGNFEDAAFGAFGEVPHRAFQAFSKVKPMVLSAWQRELSSSDVEIALSSIAKITSTWNNYSKAQLWYKLGRATDSKGNTLFEIDRDKDWNLLVAQAMGFSPTRVADIYKMEDYTRRQTTAIKDVVDTMSRMSMEYMALDNPSDTDAKNLEIIMSTIVRTLNPEQQQRAYDLFTRRFMDPQSRETRAMGKFLRSLSENEFDTLGLTRSNPFAPDTLTIQQFSEED